MRQTDRRQTRIIRAFVRQQTSAKQAHIPLSTVVMIYGDGSKILTTAPCTAMVKIL